MSKKSSSANPYRTDVLVFLIAIPFINAINYYLTYDNISLSWFLLLTFSIDTMQGYIAWWAVRQFIFFLDKKWSYENGGLRRIGVQLIVTLFLGLCIISLLTELLSWTVKGKLAPVEFYTVDLFIIGIWFFVVNGIYIGLYYYNLWQAAETHRTVESHIMVQGLMVKIGRQEIKLRFDEVAGFSVEGEYVVAIHLTGKKYIVDQSLDKIEKIIPPAQFFRLNRQHILHRQIITGFKREENGKIIVLSNKHESFPMELIVSRIKAPAFKAWFRPAP